MRSLNLRGSKSFSVALVIAVIFSLLGVLAEGQEKIKLGSQPFISHAGLFIALEKGYFAKEGVEVENKVSRASGAQMLTALVAGDYDIIGAGLTVATYNAALRGVDIRIIADKGGNKGERSYAWILVRKDLFDKGLKSLADLKGRKIGTPGVGTANWIELMMLLEKGGVAPEEVKLVDLNAPDRVSSLAAGTIDAMIAPEPFVAQAKATGKAVELVSVGDLGMFLEAVLMTTGSAINQRRDALKRFLKAYVRGAKDYNDNPRDSTVVAAIAKHTGLDRAIVERSHPFYMDPSGRVPEDVVQKQMEWLIKRNLLSKAVPLEKLIDNSLLPK
jgi:NitT/TauT family transport system substrate-binding protein